jgi:hypothetical protein
MAVAQGYGKTVTSGSVFAFDVADTRNSYIGEPTTNVLYSYDPFLVSQITWTNSGEWTVNSNETDIEKPTIPGVNTNSLRILSGRTITVGSQHIGCAFSGTTLSPSTTYTISIWFRQNRAGSNQPYFRTNVNNNSMGNFNYNGNTDASTWPVNQWIKISATATIQANENGIYLSNYIGSQVDDKVWYFAAQIEAKNYATSLALGTRSATQGLLPLVGNSTLDLSTVSFDSNAQITFDGTDDRILTSQNIALNGSQTFEVITTISGGPQSPAGIISNHDYENTSNFGLNHIGGNRIGISIGYTDNSREYDSKYTTYTVTVGTPFHLVMTFDQPSNTVKLYINGALDSTFVLTKTVKFTSRPVVLGRWDYQYNYYYFNGKIPAAKTYNRALSAGEVRQNYLHYKTRFNLS